tara:strand:+ start:609 stop:1076 length:468 start_codon:yes stop_codon:yes gene_type:complete
MKNWKDLVLDSDDMWPKSTHVDLEKPFVDSRGSIQMLVNTPMKNITLITSETGALRANHYHLTDWHYMYMLEGKAEYHFRQAESKEKPKMLLWKEGELVFTPPMEEHTTVFLQKSRFIAMSRNPRDQEAYEADVRRVQLIDPESIKDILKKYKIS